MNYDIVFNPGGAVHFPDLPQTLFATLEALGGAPPGGAQTQPAALPGYLLAKRTRAPLTPDGLASESTASLWHVHDETRQRAITAGVASAGNDVSLLDLKIELARRSLTACDLCELRCGADRWGGQRGECGSRRDSFYGRCFLNWGEERHLIPSISIFLGGCNWHCPFCQYPEHLNPAAGRPVEPAELSARIHRLWQAGGVNTHWVGGNPDQHLWAVLNVLRACDVPIPVVWNSNGYASDVTLKLLDGVADTHLMDFRYGSETCAARYRAGPRAWKAATRNLRQAAGQRCELIVRHLQLPGHFECCTTPILHWLAENLPSAKVNLLNGQYRPAYVAYQFPEIDRRLTPEEKQRALALAQELGLELIS